MKKRGPKHIDREAFYRKSTYAAILLTILTLVVYFRSLSLDYTRLDDSIFIIENETYNSNLKNLATSFQRGLFHPTQDAYYRPVFLVDFILESKLFGTNPAGYHFTNLLYHILSVLLLYFFLNKTGLGPLDSLILSAIFSVHPVLTQAVVWIPGRNDMLLMIFFLGSFLLLLRFTEKPAWWRFTLHLLLFLAALFTKETAIIIPLIMAGYILVIKRLSWKKLIFPALGWAVCTGIWLGIRSTATLAGNYINLPDMINAGLSRIGVIIQYLGKIFLPVNLAVFPEYQDITLIWGFIALALFTGLIIYSKSYLKPLTYLGLFWFLIFLLPVLIVPKNLNDQVFEHRLYLPVIGIFLMLSQTVLFKKEVSDRKKLLFAAPLILVFAIVSIYRTSYFKDPLTFWTKAVEGSPRSAYAHTLLGTKVEVPEEREALFRKAYALDPDLKNLNYYLGKVLLEKKQIDSARLLLNKEIQKNPIPDAWFLLAQISFEQNMIDSAAWYLEKVIEIFPTHPQANHNLALLYYHHGQTGKARRVIEEMEKKGMEPGSDLRNMVMK